ncbi:MAG: ABC transporter permease, partial [Bacteroidales bacterium]|nr:ABC transporter permease [Bacteroidales bacterium]
MEETHSDSTDFTTVIEPRTRLFDVNLKELWRYRDLLGLFVKRNIAVQYKQTILGPLWYIVQPAMTVIMYMVVFGGIAGIPPDGIPQPLFYLSGVCIWQYFADCL